VLNTLSISLYLQVKEEKEGEKNWRRKKNQRCKSRSNSEKEKEGGKKQTLGVEIWADSRVKLELHFQSVSVCVMHYVYFHSLFLLIRSNMAVT
jgi:hypothetical protein